MSASANLQRSVSVAGEDKPSISAMAFVCGILSW